MKSAYYSKNQSYSRSYNAERAEEDGRLPLTRAAAMLGLSVKAFKAGAKKMAYEPSEWHHVGKYANKVDYYDTNELRENIQFWMGARNKTNRSYCREQMKPLIRKGLTEKLSPAPIVKLNKFSSCLIEYCQGKGTLLTEICRYLQNKGEGEKQYVRYGVTFEEELRFDRNGSPYTTGREFTKELGGWIKPFNLTHENLKKITREISLVKFNRAGNKRYPKFYKSYISFDRGNVQNIIRRIKHGIVYKNSLAGCTYKDWLAAAKILAKTSGATYTDINGRVTISMPKK